MGERLRLAIARAGRPLLRGDLLVLGGDEFPGGLVAVQPPEDFHRDAPIRGATPILVEDVEQNGALHLGQGFDALGHAR